MSKGLPSHRYSAVASLQQERRAGSVTAQAEKAITAPTGVIGRNECRLSTIVVSNASSF